MRVCSATHVSLHRCLTYITCSAFMSSRHAETHSVSITQSSLLQRCAPWTFVDLSDWVVVSGAVLEQQRISDLERQVHHAEAAARTAETRAAQLDARQNEARALDMTCVGKPTGFDGQGSVRNFRFQFMACCGAMGAGMEMEEASRRCRY